VRFDYYERLSARERRIYLQSDGIAAVPLPDAARFAPLVAALEQALGAERRVAVQSAASALVGALTRALEAPPVRVRVLAKRPKNREGELHGLYTLEEDGRAHIEVWMRTAEKKRVVAFRTFLRTLLHELCHHLDLTHFGLDETFHTEGFFRRESSLVRQLSPRREPARSEHRSDPDPEPVQLTLFS
jgi:hypothetical protein